MNERERLVELLKSVPFGQYRLDDYYSDGTLSVIADHLIANGVAVPVKCKRCPDLLGVKGV